MIQSYLADRITNSSPFIDELATSEGGISPSWEKLAEYYQNMEPGKMSYYYEEISRQLRKNGVTYNSYGNPEGMNRPWKLDPVPMVFGTEDWAHIEYGLKQRAHLLNEILRDLYNSRSLIKNGLLPFELIYNHKGFIRQMDKILVEDKQHLIQYSADMARGPDGRMWVLYDHTDAPGGSGYTFENRSAMTRVFPDLIRENRVRKISSYYQTLKNTLAHLSSRSMDNPRVVLLSPGPTNAAFFEHAYLSSLMGFTLALGEDLTMSDGFVWLRTIKGLVKVDVIIRRVDDLFCDPLEFRNDSQLGVVGLMESIRQRKVLVINPLGTRILENPGLMPFLSKICKEVLGEDLVLPSVATWWCGQPKEMNFVLDNLDTLIIRKIYRDPTNKPVFGGDLSKDEKDKLKREIKGSPNLYVGQEMVNFSTSPSWLEGRFQARNAIFRSYVIADSMHEEYQVMPGGLSRSSSDIGAFIVSNQTEGISKDTWVLGKNHSEKHPLQKKEIEVVPVVKNVLPSRTGERLFWLGRYMERSVCTVRLMRIVLLTYNEADEDIHITEDKVLSTLLKSLTQLTGTLPGFMEEDVLKNPEEELLALASDVNKSGSLAQSVQNMLNNTYSVRDRLSLDTWRILDSIASELNNLRNVGKDITRVHYGLDDLIIKLMGFYGLNIDNMTREPTWHLLNTGRFIESAINNCTVLASMLKEVFDEETERLLLEHTLRSNESLVTYRYRYRSQMDIRGVLTLLLVSEDNPRSVVYQCLKMDYHLSKLPLTEEEELSRTRRKLLEVITMLRLCDIDELGIIDTKTSTYKNLNTFLGRIIELLQNISNLIYENHFNHTSNRYSRIQTDNLPEI